MNAAVDFVTHPDIALLRLFVAGLLGGLIGVERERAAHANEERMFAYLRQPGRTLEDYLNWRRG